jgi:phage-related protein
MSDQNDLSGKISLDTTDFKAAISAINRDIRVVESGFRASAASLGDWSKSAAGLESRIKALTTQIELQQKKASALQAEYNRVKTAKGENSKAAQELQIKLNKENETLGKMQFELKNTQTSLDNMGKEEKETKEDTDKLEKSEKQATETTGKLGSAFKTLTGALGSAGSALASMAGKVLDLAKGLAVGLVGGATAAAGAITVMINQSAQWAGKLAELSATSGITTTRLQELNYIGTALDAGMETVSGSMVKLTRSMAGAADGTGPAADAFGTLGVSIKNADGSLRDSQDVWLDAIDALGEIENTTERDALAMELFGRSANELRPLIAAGSDELARLAEQAHLVGAVMSEEDVTALDDMGDAGAGLKASIQGITGTLAAAFAPAITAAIGLLQRLLANPAVQAGLTSLKEGISKIAEILTTAFSSDNPFAAIMGSISRMSGGSSILTSIGNAMGRLAGIFDRLKKGFASGGLSGMLSSLIPSGGVAGILASLAPTIGNLITGMLTSFTAQPARLLQVGLDIINGLAQGLLTAIPALIPVFLQLITSFVNFITTTLPTLLQLGLTVLVQIGMGIIQAIPQLIPVVLQLITSFVQFLVTNLPMIISAAVQLIVTLAQGIALALPTLIPTILGIIPGLIITLLENLPLLITAALQIIMALVQGIIAALPVLVPEIPKIVQTIITVITENLPLVISMALTLITTLVDALIANLPMIVQAAIDIISALLQGIVDMLPDLITAAGDIITTIVDALGDLIPNLVSAGGDLVAGIWDGFTAAWDGLIESMSGVIAGLPDWVKKILGIASPSKVFAEIGQNMAAGLGSGFQSSYRDIRYQIGRAIEGLSAQASMTVGGTMEAGGRQQLQPAPIYITIQGAPDNELGMRRLARYVANEIQRGSL